MEPKPQDIFVLVPDINEDDKAIITKAFDFSKNAHRTQERNSGEPYFNHLFEVACNLARMNADPVTIAAGLLHDVLEDTDVIEEELTKEFGPEIVFLVQGVTKLGHLKYKGVIRHAESLRKFFIASAHDIRVVIIKLADRLHNISTLQHVPKEKQQRIAIETLEIYARLADRLGMGSIKSQLEDMAFPYAYPEEFEKVTTLLKDYTSFTEPHLAQVAETLKEELMILEADVTRLDYRVKHLYSLWQKLKQNDYDITKIYDILALRILVPTVSDCYHALGIIHGLYKPLPGRFKDYIALPKPNGYRSLHTTVFDGSGEMVEIQIRTEGMHHEAEYGISSHVYYKEIGKNKDEKTTLKNIKKSDWTKELLEAQKNIENPEDFLKHLHLDFFEKRVFVYTPKGDVIELPEGSSTIDFAYAIHSDIGNHISGAKINGKMVSIDTQLQRGDVVEITHNERQKPNRKWLDMCKTTFAKTHIRKYLKEKGGMMDKMLLR
jgi:guanosine-3',5'-bis(diphosphate) 3'-pyrophosphohydrolase